MKTRKSIASVLLGLCLGSVVPSVHAQGSQLPREDVIDVPAIGDGLCISNLFQSHMVLQRDKPLAVWGWAAPGEKVSVSIGGQTRDATAGPDRAWQVAFDPMPANSTPQRMTVKGAKDSLTLDDILLGDVWVLGGQSNMEFELTKVENGPLEIVSANFPEIRILTVPYAEGQEMRRSFPRLHEWSGWFGRHFRKGDWDHCTPEIARDLSAIGYVFARRIHKASGVPIGVIDASRGGTTVETWTPLPVLRAMDSGPVKEKLAEWDAKVAGWDPRKDLENRIARHRQFVERMEQEGKPVPADRIEPSDLLPGPIADHNYPGACFAGMISPLAGFAVKGAIFHQGYNNAFEGMPGVAMYADVFPAMIQSWREAFNDPAMPFGILSLCTEGHPQTRENYVEHMHNTGIYIREAQYQAFLDFHQAGDRNIGYASTYDLRRRWYHPQLKLPAGERIARWALATQYGFERELQWKPPFITGMETGGGRIVLEFDGDVGDPEDGAMEGFAISGNDGRFQPATADYLEEGKDDRGRPRLNRKKLVLASPLVPEPVHYRYAWGRNPLANVQLTGNKDLPLATQRSDSWSMHEIPFGVLGDEAPDPKSRPQQNKIRQALRRDDMKRRLAEAGAFIGQNQDAYRNELEKHVATFNRHDHTHFGQAISNEDAAAWMAANVPLFECPDPEIEEIYHFRWWTYRKHIKETPDGYVITEFLPKVPWSGKHNTISCPAGHHFREGRWIRDPKYLEDYAVFWFRKGGAPRRYSFWAADSLYQFAIARGDFKLAIELLPDLVANYEEWEKSRLADDGLFWQVDDRDGMEVSVGGRGHGGKGRRATINSYMFGDAMAIAAIAERAGKPEIAATHREKAARIRKLVQEKLWDGEAEFFKVLPLGENAELADVRELHGYTPWYFHLPEKGKGYERAWKQLMDSKGFHAPFGPTTAEQRHPGFAVSYTGHECQWNGPSWPFATTVTLTALANVLNDYPQDVIGKGDWFETLKTYTRSHRLTREDGTVVPWIDENLNPHTGDWIARTRLSQWKDGTWDPRKGGPERGKDYNHSAYCDLIVTGLAGLRPQADGSIVVNPLLPDGTWDWFCLDGIPYHGRSLTILYDKTGEKYQHGKGLVILADGKIIARSARLERLLVR